MRIRTIKPEFFTHDRLYDAEVEFKMPLRIAFAGLWCAADREGRFKWEPRRLGVQILPYDKVDFSRVLDALVTRGFLVKYASESGEFGWIPGFERHQVINNKERASELPEPILEADSNACPTRAPRVDDACRKEGKGREQGREGKEPPISPKGDGQEEAKEPKPAKSKLPTTPEAKRIATLMHRQLTTAWAEPEIRAYRAIMPIPEPDLAAVESYYSAHWPPNRDQNILRHDLKTLLNNWPGEVDRANTWALNKSKPKPMNTANLF